ncbi:hypothetical protein NQ315_009595 [Exocentrus adspersus]|uniref:Uncharacterized protein n=1 Tax=Exocentrus adspersus TaxID=1586481 RepID=A0AAV8WHP2_9CUCU|nr:hypothetical protein NQ315_009595 [Exocentrus adspersus]
MRLGERFRAGEEAVNSREGEATDGGISSEEGDDDDSEKGSDCGDWDNDCLMEVKIPKRIAGGGRYDGWKRHFRRGFQTEAGATTAEGDSSEEDVKGSEEDDWLLRRDG